MQIMIEDRYTPKEFPKIKVGMLLETVKGRRYIVSEDLDGELIVCNAHETGKLETIMPNIAEMWERPKDSSYGMFETINRQRVEPVKHAIQLVPVTITPSKFMILPNITSTEVKPLDIVAIRKSSGEILVGRVGNCIEIMQKGSESELFISEIADSDVIIHVFPRAVTPKVIKESLQDNLDITMYNL